MNNIIASAALQILSPVLVFVATFAIGLLSQQVGKFIGLKNEKLLRDALHQSAENGLKFAIAKGVPQNQVLNAAADYVREMSPDTVKRSGIKPDELKDIIRTKTVPPAVSG